MEPDAVALAGTRRHLTRAELAPVLDRFAAGLAAVPVNPTSATEPRRSTGPA